MKKIIFESIEDIEMKLRSSDFINSIIEQFGVDKFKSLDSEVCDWVISELDKQDGTSATKESVVVCKVVGNDIDLIDQSHDVIKFNGFYYDYTAQQFNDSFSGLIGISNFPVVQPVIYSDNQITDKLSTVKGYVMLGY